MDENELMNDENQPVPVTINGVPAMDYGKVQSAIKPDPVVINSAGVWVHSNVEPLPGGGGFEYNMLWYDKNDYDKIKQSGGDDSDDDYEFTAAEIKAYNVGSMRGAGLRGIGHD